MSVDSMGGRAYTSHHRDSDVNTSRIRSIGNAVAGITAVVYFGLVCLVAMCNPAMPAASGSGEHSHHDHDVAHSPLCVWACQAISSGTLLTAAPEEASVLVVPADVDPPHDPLSVSSSALRHSRAPPILPLG